MSDDAAFNGRNPEAVKPKRVTKPKKAKTQTPSGKKLKSQGPDFIMYQKGLRGGGFEESKAEAIVVGLREHIMSEVATRENVVDMATHMENLLSAESIHIRAEVKTTSQTTIMSLSKDISEVRSKVEKMDANFSSKSEKMDVNFSSKLEKMDANFSSKSEKMDVNFSSKLEKMDVNFSSKVEKMDANFSSKSEKMDANFNSFKSDFSSFKAEVERRFKAAEENTNTKLTAMEARLKAEIAKAMYKCVGLLGGLGSAIYAIEKIF